MEKIAFNGLLAWALSLAGLTGGWIYGCTVERKWLAIRQVHLPLARLPRQFSGFRLVLVSDTHLGLYFGPPELARVVEAVNRLVPDAICFAGDLLDTRSSPGVLGQAVPLLTELKAPAGKYAVLGNHDYRRDARQVIRELSRGGFRVLINEHAVLEKSQARLYLIGLDDILEGRPNLTTATEGIPAGACRILLVHEPDYANETKKYDLDLQLSGHSHGGQVRLPIIGPLAGSKLGKKYPTGLYRVGNLFLYTNRGLGTTVLPVRFFCRPEITMLILE